MLEVQNIVQKDHLSTTSVMIYHRGASLSELHTDLLIRHCTKQDLSRTNKYADKSSPETARYRIARAATVSMTTLYI